MKEIINIDLSLLVTKEKQFRFKRCGKSFFFYTLYLELEFGDIIRRKPFTHKGIH